MKAQHLMCDNRKLWANTSLHVTSHIFIKLFQEKKKKKASQPSPCTMLRKENARVEEQLRASSTGPSFIKSSI